MTDGMDFDTTSTLLNDLGFTLGECMYSPKDFGSWFINAHSNGKALRVVWDGRDGTLAIQEPSFSGRADEWSDRWIARQGDRNSPGELRAALRPFLRD